MTEPLLTAEQAGELLGVPASWMLQEARADRVPYLKLGRYTRFSAAELEVWWQSRRRGPWRTSAAASQAARDQNKRAA